MRIAKTTTLTMISLMLIAIGCGKNGNEAPSAEEMMKKNKKVIILTDPVNPPFEYGAGTDVQGLNVDIGNEIGKTLGIDVKWVKISGYERMFELLKNGEAEIIISSIAIDPKWANEFAFSRPYYESGDVIAHQRSVFDIKDLTSLSGKKIGVAASRPGDAFASTQKTAANVSVVRYPTLDDALGALNLSELDAVIGDEPMIAYSIVNSYSNTTLLPNQVNTYRYAAVVRKNETELLQKINETIDRLEASGELQKLKEKWVGDIVKQAIERGQADKAVEEKKKSPKTINITLHKVSGAWNMDRLDGFQLVLEGPAGRYQSSHISTEGNRGTCKFTSPVPPGEYRLQMPILRSPAKVLVPDLPKTALAMEIRIIGGTISIASK